MIRSFYRRLLLCCFVVALILSVIILQHPSQSLDSAVVFSNMPNAINDGEFVTTGQDVVSIFDVPSGSNFQINSIQVPFGNGTAAVTVSARIHTESTGLPGSVVVDLGSQSVPVGNSVATFTPAGANGLSSGTRYWLVMSNPGAGVQWQSANPPITPTGVFSFVDNGVVVGGTFFSQALRFNITIDADPGGSGSSSGGCNVDGRLNPVCAEPWQTAAIYCLSNGAIEVYGITDSVGWLAFRTTQSEIDAVGVPAQNSLIERSSDGKIRLYRLSTGEFQVNSPIYDRIRGNLPDGYVFIFEGCS